MAAHRESRSYKTRASGRLCRGATVPENQRGTTPQGSLSAVMRLGARSFVDVAGWDDYGCRTYSLTEKGAAVEHGVNVGEDDDEWAAAEVARWNKRHGR